jgi:prevent-host-death family protein
MKHVGAFEAKTHFSELLEAVSKGETYTITKHGHEVAMLVPIRGKGKTSPVKKAILDIKKRRKGVVLGKELSISQMKSEGRS